MVAVGLARVVSPGEYVPTADHRVVLRGVDWSSYEAMLALRGESSVPRIAFVDGVIELMSPSKDHERIKSYFGRLVEAFAEEEGIDLSPYGAWTLKAGAEQAGAEPDECYLIGADQDRDTPDLVIEVIWTSGGIDKLEAYRRLRVREVWFWRNDAVEIHVLRRGRYENTGRSVCLPSIDLGLLCSFMARPTVLQAVAAYRAALRRRPTTPRAPARRRR